MVFNIVVAVLGLFGLAAVVNGLNDGGLSGWPTFCTGVVFLVLMTWLIISQGRE